MRVVIGFPVVGEFDFCFFSGSVKCSCVVVCGMVERHFPDNTSHTYTRAFEVDIVYKGRGGAVFVWEKNLDGNETWNEMEDRVEEIISSDEQKPRFDKILPPPIHKTSLPFITIRIYFALRLRLLLNYK